MTLDRTLFISVHLAWTVKSEAFFFFYPIHPPIHEHAGHISAIVMVSLGLSGDLGAPTELSFPL